MADRGLPQRSADRSLRHFEIDVELAECEANLGGLGAVQKGNLRKRPHPYDQSDWNERNSSYLERHKQASHC